MRRALWTVGVAIGLFSCGGALPGPEGVGDLGGDSAALEKYDLWIVRVDGLRANVDEAQRWVDEAPKALAVSLGLPETASHDEIRSTLQQKLAAAGITASGSLTVQINFEAGASGSAEAGAGGAAAEGQAHASASVEIVAAADVEITAEVQQIIDAVKACLEHIAAIKPRLEPVVAELEVVLGEGQQLAGSVTADFTGMLAAQAPEYTAKIQERVEYLTGLSGSLTGTISASVEIQGSVSAGVSGG